MKQKFLSIIFNLLRRKKTETKPKINTKNIYRNKFGYPQIKDN